MKINDYNKNYASINNSLKLVSLFGLIESLSDVKYQDFYQWLCVKNKELKLFPIHDRKALSKLYNEYKRAYGSIRRCVAFFTHLPEDSQKELLDTIKIKECGEGGKGRPMKSIEEMAKFLYEKRSKFVHEAYLFNLGGPDHTVIEVDGKMMSISSLAITDLQTLFEEGLLKHFSELNKTRKAQA